MQKLMITVLLALLTVAAFGCAAKDEVKQEIPSIQPTDMQPTDIQPTEKVVKEFQPNLGGIKLGDSKEQVIQSFGTEYKQTIFDEDFSLGEPFVKLRYTNGITVVLGSNSSSVLEIESNSPSTSTNLGFKIGDKAQDVLDNYRSKYKEPDSRHGDGKLIGWFIINDQQELVIFNFEKGESWGNVNVKPDAQVEKIRLTNFQYMD